MRKKERVLTFVAALGLIVAMSLLPFLKRFPDDEACWAHLKAVRWPNGPVCPHCGAVDEAHSAGVEPQSVDAGRAGGGRRRMATAARVLSKLGVFKAL
jgi:Transposase zinc-ribbon domain